jgi:hypothetical protein
MLKELLDIIESLQNIDLNKLENIEKSDFSTQEGIDKLKDFINVIQENVYLTYLLGEDNIKLINDYIIEAENKLKRGNQPKRPSLQTSENVKKNIANLVQEYTSTTIFPYINENITDKQKSEIIDSLFEFGCWLYNK